MIAKMTAVDPGKIEFEVTIRLSLAGWEALREHIVGSKGSEWVHYPMGDIVRAIPDMVRQAETVFEPAKADG